MSDDVRASKAAARAEAAAEKAHAKAMRPWFKKKRFIIPMAFIALLVVSVAANSGGDDNGTRIGTAGNVERSEVPTATSDEGADESQPAPNSSSDKKFAVGDVVSRGSLEATVLSVNGEYVPSNEFERGMVDDGKKVVGVEFQLKNTGTDTENISTLLQHKLRDNTNAQYDVGFLGPEPRFPEGELAPGQTNRGWVSFEVPTAAGGFEFVFDAEVFGGGRITWVL